MKLYKEYSIKDMILKNRIVMPPMCMYSASEDGLVKDWHYTHYTSRGVGQTGLIILEATAVSPNGRISSNDLGIWNDDQISGLKRISNGCQEYGSKIAIQLAHAGRKCGVKDEITVAPSSFKFSERYKIPKELSTREIGEVINDFKEGARRAMDAEFDAIEIHGAHGYLIHEFLSPISNKRTDEYGGSLENRVRFLREIIKSIKTVWPKEKPIIVRLSADDYLKNGIDINETIKIVNYIKKYVDIIHVSSGGIDVVDIEIYPGYQVKYAEKIKNECNIPTIAVGLITKYEQAEEILSNNRADLVALGRELLRNPYWPIHSARENNIEIDVLKQYERAIK